MSGSSISSLIQQACLLLEDSSDSPLLDAQILLADILEKDRSYLMAWPELIPTEKEQAVFQSYLQQRQQEIPIAYILGYKEFWSMRFDVTPEVLIPRPETELLVEQVLDACEQNETASILELGTGSGAIAISLATELPKSQVTATDISESALKVARRNAQHHQINNISFLYSDWFTNIASGKFDIIVSNPPYIEKNDSHLLTNIRHEPLQALASDEDGLGDIRIIVNNSKSYLNKQGKLLVEHGYNQGKKVRELLKKAGFINYQTLKDHANNDRITFGSI